MSTKDPPKDPPKDPWADTLLARDANTENLAVTRIRATPYDMVILWSEPGVSDWDMAYLADLAEDLAEVTGCVAVALVPSDIVTNVTAHGLDSLLRLRAHLDDCIETMTIEHPGCGEA